MSDESAQALATEQAAARVSKAAEINDAVYARLHQYDSESFGVKSAADRSKAKNKPKVADKP